MCICSPYLYTVATLPWEIPKGFLNSAVGSQSQRILFLRYAWCCFTRHCLSSSCLYLFVVWYLYYIIFSVLWQIMMYHIVSSSIHSKAKSNKQKSKQKRRMLQMWVYVMQDLGYSYKLPFKKQSYFLTYNTRWSYESLSTCIFHQHYHHHPILPLKIPFNWLNV